MKLQINFVSKEFNVSESASLPIDNPRGKADEIKEEIIKCLGDGTHFEIASNISKDTITIVPWGVLAKSIITLTIVQNKEND